MGLTLMSTPDTLLSLPRTSSCVYEANTTHVCAPSRHAESEKQYGNGRACSKHRVQLLARMFSSQRVPNRCPRQHFADVYKQERLH